MVLECINITEGKRKNGTKGGNNKDETKRREKYTVQMCIVFSNVIYFFGFQGSDVLDVRINFFWDVKLFSVVDRLRRFGGTLRVHFQGGGICWV
jgi:hypothetical protein